MPLSGFSAINDANLKVMYERKGVAMNKVVEKVKEILLEKELDAVLVSDGFNMRNISGFTGATGYLLITGSSKNLITDSRYTVAAKAQAPEFNVVEISTGKGYISCINEILENEKIKKLGFESNDFRYSTYLAFKEKINVKELVPITDELTRLRRVKTQEEIECLKKAEHIGDIAFKEILSHIKPGVTELDIAAKLEYIMKCNGAEKLSFETIVASGLNSAKPHAEPGEKKIEMGDFVTMDFGCMYHGYCSDMTRTVVVGKADRKQRKIYDVVLRAQTAVLDVLKPGMAGKEYDKIARDIITEAGYGEYFGHSLGHSVGLEIHESPNFSVKEESIFEAGNVVTVEPGIYIPDFGGVRIEDMVVLTEDGYMNFTHSKKELIEL